MNPPAVIPEPGQEDLARALEAARMRPCLLCGSAGDPVLRRCSETHRMVMPMLVVARGAANELAFVPVSWDAVGEAGCPRFDLLGLLRPAACRTSDAAVRDAVEAAGGFLWIADRYTDSHCIMRATIEAAAVVVAWDVAAVYPFVDADVLHGPFRPRRTLVAPGAPRYGRWPAPWVPWVSLADRVPWSEPPFRARGANGGLRSPEAACRAVGLPVAGADAHPLAHALALAALLRSVPWRDGRKSSLGSRLLPPDGPNVANVGISAGKAYRPGADGHWEQLFEVADEERAPTLVQVEQAAGHLRMVDALVPADSREGVR